MLPETRRRAFALTARIVAGYTLAAAAILTASALFLYRGLKQGFVVEDTELLSDQVDQVRGLVGKGAGGLAEARHFILAAAGVRDLEKYYGRLLDERGAVVVETPGIAQVAPETADFSAPLSAGRQVKSIAFSRSPRGRLTLLASAKIARPDGVAAWVFQIALDADHVDKWLTKYRHRLWWMVGCGTLGTALLGWLITRRGLRPLRQITAAVKDVTAHEMRGRIDAEKWPAELAVLAEEFDDMLARLRGSFDRLTQFSADVAHEFRTPLSNLMGATSLTLSHRRTAEEYRAALEGNLEQFDRLKRMVESLLFIARADDAEAVLNKHSCDAPAIAREVCDFFSALAEERGVALECSGAGTAEADEVLLRLALTNLLSNALRHTPRAGRVQVKIGARDGGCEITVADTGTGIASEHHARLFDRFYRVDAARGGSESGSGLGLAIVRTVMALHGGSVAVENGAEGGTIFRLHFPALPAGRK